jgi:hypothetical protein
MTKLFPKGSLIASFHCEEKAVSHTYLVYEQDDRFILWIGSNCCGDGCVEYDLCGEFAIREEAIFEAWRRADFFWNPERYLEEIRIKAEAFGSMLADIIKTKANDPCDMRAIK